MLEGTAFHVSCHAGTYSIQVIETKGHSCHDDGQGTIVSPSVTRGTCRDTQTQQTLTARAADITHAAALRHRTAEKTIPTAK